MSETNPWRLLWLLAPVALALLALFGVLKLIRDRDRAAASFAVDHVAHGPRIPPRTIAQGDFAVGRPQRFSFIVPPHVLTPRLRGEFSTFARGRDGARLSDSTGGIDFMLLNEFQYQDFVRGSSTAQAMYAYNSSHQQALSLALPATLGDPVHYYVIMRKAGEEKAPVWVRADLVVDFDSSP
jgi:hypothetical protein